MLYNFLKSTMHEGIVLMMAVFCALSVNAQEIHRKIEVKWTIEDGNLGKENPISKFVFYNTSKEDVHCKNWSLWFNFMRGINVNSVDKKFKITHKNGDLYQLSFVAENLTIPANGSIEVSFKTNGTLPNFTDAPAGLYLTYDDATQINAHPVIYNSINKEYPLGEKLNILAAQYDLNRLHESSDIQKIIPSPSALQQGEGFYTISAKSTLWADPSFDKEGIYFRKFLKETSGITLSSKKQDEKSADIKMLQNLSLGEEAYKLVINSKGITIFAAAAKGAFYAVQSLKALLPARYWNINLEKIEIPAVNIRDQPRYGYRGLMLDVARNFHSKETVKRIIDLMAMYKLNTLHLHLNDDEGWRLEIPSLPELTEVGSVRSAFYADGNSLQPAYGSGENPQTKLYYSVNDFKEILLYAQKNHIQVIPELETPGHARAAIKSMEARYRKLMKLGDKQEAEKYLLNDKSDQSEYFSAQSWNDNVMNVAKPSVYNFISKVLDELKEMYQAAGVPLGKVHLGGDEVPRGAWEKSPEIARLRDSLKFSSVNQVWPYYIKKIADLCKLKGLKLAGWEEMGMVNNGNGMVTNQALVNQDIQVDVWNNLIGGGQEDLAYHLANSGYKVVYTSASNFYFDIAWKNAFNEPGHTWAGFTNVKKSYSFLPENYFLNVFTDNFGEKLTDGFLANKVRLTEEGKRNIIGIKGAAWSEKILNGERLESMLFPRVIALAERAWAPKPIWETGTDFNETAFAKDYASFMTKLGTQELQKLNTLNGGYRYRLPAVGLRVYEESLMCNVEYPGFDIYYTSDGTEPNLQSKKYSQIIPLDRSKTYQFRVITKDGKVGDIITLKF
jgi:hexosaminidase